ncbi:hypothetical protein AB6A40_003604 [Gnathostoma spinigerum]|uniref:Uncharacterized protein n=1 Tax=Gnathostoma spinigerum TaxID=75299 RepID=A0ABD6EA21_9BILA
MNADRVGAILQWYVGFGEKCGISPVDGMTRLCRRHIPTLLHFIKAGNLTVKESTANVIYQQVLEAIAMSQTDEPIIEKLNVEGAVAGDTFEIAKFLVALLNELRISNAEAVLPSEGSYGLSSQQISHLKRIFLYMDNSDEWDRNESWPAVLFIQDCTSPPVILDHVTPKVVKRSDMMISYSTGRKEASPLNDVLNSPSVREKRIIREKDRKIRDMQKRIFELEGEKDEIAYRMKYFEASSNRDAERLASKTSEYEHSEELRRKLEGEIDDWKIRYSEMQKSQTAITKQLTELLDYKRKACEDISQKEFELTAKNSEIETRTQRCSQLTNELRKFSDENDELKEKVRLQRLERIENEKKWKERESELIASLEEYERIIVSTKAEYSEEIKQKEEEFALENQRAVALAAKLAEAERRSQDEINRIKQSIKEKSGADAATLDIVQHQVGVLTSELSAMKNECDAAREESRKLRTLLTEKSKEIFSLKREISNISAQAQSLETQLSIRKETVEKMALDYASLSEEKNQALRIAETARAESELAVTDRTLLKKKVDELERELLRMRDANLKQINEYTESQKELMEKVAQLEARLLECQARESDLIHQIAKQNSEWECKCSSLEKTIEKATRKEKTQSEIMQKRIDSLESSLVVWKNECSSLTKQLEESKVNAGRQIQDLLDERNVLNAKMTETIGLLEDRIQQLNDEKSTQLMAQRETYEVQISKLSEKYSRLFADKIAIYENTSNKETCYRAELNQLRRDNENLREDIISIRSKTASVSGEFQRAVEAWREKENDLNLSLSKLRAEKANTTKLIGDLRQKMMGFKSQSAIEVTRLNARLTQKENENEELNDQIYRKETELAELKRMNKQQESKLNRQRDQISKLITDTAAIEERLEKMGQCYLECQKALRCSESNVQSLTLERDNLVNELAAVKSYKEDVAEGAADGSILPGAAILTGLADSTSGITHPRIECAEEGTSLCSSTMDGQNFPVEVDNVLPLASRPECSHPVYGSYARSTPNQSTDSLSTSWTSDQVEALKKRNENTLPHLRTVYPAYVFSQNKERTFDENDFRQSAFLADPCSMRKQKVKSASSVKSFRKSLSNMVKKKNPNKSCSSIKTPLKEKN